MAEIIIDRRTRFGKPIIKGTRIAVAEVLGALAGGMTFAEVESEYGLKREDILAAIGYAADIISEEDVGLIKVKE